MKTAKNEIEIAQRYLDNPYWRMNNLYSIVDKEGNKIPFKMNPEQDQLYKNLSHLNIILKARQMGISTMVGILFLDRCLFNPNMTAGIIAQTREDAEMMFRRVKYAYEALPEDLRAVRTVNMDNAREMKFNNGSQLYTGASMRGGTLQYLHVSEFGKLSAKFPDKAREIVTGALNTIAPGQHIIIESTAEGRDTYFYEMCKKAQALKDSGKAPSKMEYKFHFFPWFQHRSYRIDSKDVVIPTELNQYFDTIETKCKCILDPEQRAWYTMKLESQKDDMKREFPSTPEEAFESSSDGNYYSNHITKARQEKRITKVFHNPTEPVHVSWDLGFSDSTALWLFQVEGQKIHLLEYYENSGEALPFYIQWLKSKPYNYGTHLVPHDASQHEFSTGLTRTEVAYSLGVSFTQVHNVSIAEGIDAVRNIFHRCYFDEEKCAKGIKLLDSYRKQWNEKHSCWSTKPLHNDASHCADSLRMLAVGLSNVYNKDMSKEELQEMKDSFRTATSRYFTI